MPFFSIIIPTRDRPEVVRDIIQSIINQSFEDFEIIVCDNYLHKSAKKVVESFVDERIKYFTPQRPLSMIENWEYALTLASGKYLSVLGDKCALLPSALLKIYNLVKDNPCELISLNFLTYKCKNPENPKAGSFMYDHDKLDPIYFDGKEVLQRRLEFGPNSTIFNERPCWTYGMIYRGFHSAELIAKIKNIIPNIFHPLTPDYTSMTLALCLAKNCLSIGEPLAINLVSEFYSNGLASINYSKKALAYLESVDESGERRKYMPIKGLYSSIQNVIACDYLAMIKKCSMEEEFQLNKVNFYIDCKKDIDQIIWQNKKEEVEQKQLLKAYYQNELNNFEKWEIIRLDISSKLEKRRHIIGIVRNKFSQFEFFKKLVKSFRPIQKGIPNKELVTIPKTYTSILHAAEEADKYYS